MQIRLVRHNVCQLYIGKRLVKQLLTDYNPRSGDMAGNGVKEITNKELAGRKKFSNRIGKCATSGGPAMWFWATLAATH